MKTNSKIIVTNSSSYPHQLLSSAETIANNDDLLTEILLCLPIKSLLKFKSVSKHWLSLISSPYFSLLRTPITETISGLIVCPRIGGYDFINLTSTSSHTLNSFTVANIEAGILQSCNGLFLCGRSGDYSVYNPTTKQNTILPPCLVSNGYFNVIYGVSLAYDPSTPHYKVICLRACDFLEEESIQGEPLEEEYLDEWHFQIQIYSSENRRWRKSGGTCTATGYTNLRFGVFWNGAINWLSYWGNSLYFNIDEEKLHEMPMPAIPDGYDEGRRVRYFGASPNHLHFIDIYGPCTARFNVYEMERDYSGWIVKYKVDLLAVAAAFPEMVRIGLEPWDLNYYVFSILSVVREENDDDSYLVVHLPKKAIRYNLKDQSFKMLHDFAPVGTEMDHVNAIVLGWFEAFQYIESLAYVQ